MSNSEDLKAFKEKYCTTLKEIDGQKYLILPFDDYYHLSCFNKHLLKMIDGIIEAFDGNAIDKLEMMNQINTITSILEISNNLDSEAEGFDDVLKSKI